MLQPGDLLLWRVGPQANLMDRLVGWAEQKVLRDGQSGYAYYHISFVSANPKKHYSAQPPKIDLYDLPYPLPANVEIYRYKEGLNGAGLANVFRYADSRCGRWYPIIGVLSAGWLSGNLEFCSQYTEDAYCNYPLALCPEIRFATPDNIANGIMDDWQMINF